MQITQKIKFHSLTARYYESILWLKEVTFPFITDQLSRLLRFVAFPDERKQSNKRFCISKVIWGHNCLKHFWQYMKRDYSSGCLVVLT